MTYHEPDAECKNCGAEMEVRGVGEDDTFLEWLYRCPECDATGSFYWTKNTFGRPIADGHCEERGAAVWAETDK